MRCPSGDGPFVEIGIYWFGKANQDPPKIEQKNGKNEQGIAIASAFLVAGTRVIDRWYFAGVLPINGSEVAQ
jgi:hypothetical protein